jgi:hypothetical protein
VILDRTNRTVTIDLTFEGYENAGRVPMNANTTEFINTLSASLKKAKSRANGCKIFIGRTERRFMSFGKLDFRHVRMLLASLIFMLGCNGCCVGVVAKVRNDTGKEISLTEINAGQIPILPVTIPAGSSRICSGVMSDASWIVSDGKSKFVFNDVSPIGTMRGRSRTDSRFTSMFPCNRVTQHGIGNQNRQFMLSST